jgi:hypothetical protein
LLNHVEMIYRRGEKEHARAFFETMGFGIENLVSWLVVKVDPEEGNGLDNVMYANEPTPAQQNLNDAFDRVVASDAEFKHALDRTRELAREWPYYNFHFGVALATHEEWEKRVERLREANRSHPLLKGRVELVIMEPTTPRALSAQSQCFIFTDILAAGGTFAQGLQFELQWTPTPTSGIKTFQTVGEIGPGNPYPDMATMV